MWAILKVFTEFLTTLLLFYVWFFGCEACGILARWRGIKPSSPTLEGKALNTGLPGKSLSRTLDLVKIWLCLLWSVYITPPAALRGQG